MVNIAVAFILSPILLRTLGNSAFGLWELIMSVVGYMGLLDLGIGSAIVRYVAVANSSDNREDMAKIMATSLVFFVAMGFVACAMFALLGFFPRVIASEEALPIASVEILFYLFAVNVLFLFPMQVFLSALLGIQCHYFINCSRVLLIGVKSIVIYWYIISHEGYLLVFMSIVELVYTLLSFFIFYLFLLSKKKIPKFSLRSVSKKTFSDLFVFGSKNLVMMAASRLQNQSVPLIIANVVGMGSIVYYTFPNRLMDYAKGFSLAVGYPLTPYFSAVVGREQSGELRNVWLQTTFVLQAFMFILPVVLWQYGEVFLHLWIGLEYAEASRWVIKFMVIGLIADNLSVNSYRLLTAQASHGRVALIWLVLAALSIPTGVFGAKLWGVEGAVLAVVLFTMVGNLATLLLACAALKISHREYLQATCIKLVMPVTLSAGCSVLLVRSYSVISFFDLIIHVIIVGFFYCLCVWIFSLDEAIKYTVTQKLKNIIRVRK